MFRCQKEGSGFASDQGPWGTLWRNYRTLIMCVVLSINRVDGGAFGRCTCANPGGHSRRACGQATQSEQQCHAYPAVIIFIMCACGLRATDTRYMILIREYNNSLSDLGDCESTVHISFKSSKYFLFNLRLLQKAVRAVNNKHTRYGLTVNRGCGQLRAVASCDYYQ